MEWVGKSCGMKTLGNSNIQVIRRVTGSTKKDGQGTTGGKRIPGKKIKKSWEPERRESEKRSCSAVSSALEKSKQIKTEKF